MIDLPPPGYEQTIAAITSCGVPEAKIRIAFDDYLQSDVIRISDVGGDDEERLRCIQQAAHPFYIVEIEDPQQSRLYGLLALEKARVRARAEAERWLRDQGLFERAPRFEEGAMRLPDYARAVEAHCGVEPGSALELLAEGTLTPTRSFMASVLETGGQQFTCIMHVLALSNQGQGGVAFGFVSEAASVEDEE